MGKVVILLEIQDSTIYLWVDSHQVKTWKRKYTGIAGAPLEMARLLESVFSALHIPCILEFGDGFEELAGI